MNDKSYSYHSPSTKSFTSIDISFCHPSLFLDYNWSVCEDQHNSDHFPIIIKQRKQALSKLKGSPNTNNFNDIKVFREFEM